MKKMDFGLAGKTALVTGGSRGIGLATARRLLAVGAKVAICARKEEGLKQAVAELGGGDDLLALAAHVGSLPEVEALVAAVVEKFGGLDVVIANVGMNLMVPQVSAADPKLWRKIIDTNLNGAFYTARAAAGPMRASGGGSIVFRTSIAAKKAAPMMGVYGIAKAAVEQLTRVLAAELAGDGIRVNALAPAMVKTGFSAPFWQDEQMAKQITARIPLGRLAEADEVAGPALFLASKAASYITGQVITIDGGSGIV